jgi:hypothetical protein
MTQLIEQYRRAKSILPDGIWLEDIWRLEPNTLAVYGNDLLHVSGFFPDLVKVANAFQDDEFFLLDLEGAQRFIPFSVGDSETAYGAKKSNAPGLAPGFGFPYDLCRQGFVGSSWLLLSDRDAERMCFLTHEYPTSSQLRAVWDMFRIS